MLEDEVKSWIKTLRRDEVEEHSWEHPVLLQTWVCKIQLGFVKSSFPAGYKTHFRLLELRTAISERHQSATSQSSISAEPNAKCQKEGLIAQEIVRISLELQICGFPDIT